MARNASVTTRDQSWQRPSLCKGKKKERARNRNDCVPHGCQYQSKERKAIKKSEGEVEEERAKDGDAENLKPGKPRELIDIQDKAFATNDGAKAMEISMAVSIDVFLRGEEDGEENGWRRFIDFLLVYSIEKNCQVSLFLTIKSAFLLLDKARRNWVWSVLVSAHG